MLVCPTQVHVQDVVDAFLFLLVRALYTSTYPEIVTGWETFHSVEVHSESVNWRTISEKIGDHLYDLGRIPSRGAISIPWDPDLGPLKGSISANAQSLADRLRAEGWLPRQKSMMECLRGDVEDVLELRDQGRGG